MGVGLGLILMLAVWLFDYRKLKDWLLPLFVLDALLLISPRIPFLASQAKGAARWINIPFTKISLFQPSEPAKIVTILLIAAIIASYEGSIDTWRGFWKVVGLSLIPFFAVMVQPDLGTGLVFILIMLGLLLVGGAKKRYLLTLIAVMIAVISLVFWVNNFVFERTGNYPIIKEYQVDRLGVFLNPEADKTGDGYDLNQSKIAIGSGGTTGKGLGEGTQSQFDFISERSTDYIFSVLGEETGFVGTVALMGLYLALLVVSLSVANSSSDLYGTLICAGIVSMWTFQIMENVGMTMGLMPITGIPLPFMSYGSSSMVTNLIAVGLLLSVWRRRPYLRKTKGASHGLSI
jgi:rod shape determining protein RodA